MKIYYASQSFYPLIGGVSTYLLNLAKQMVKQGNEVVEVHLRPSGETGEDEVKGIQVHRVPREPLDRKMLAGYSKFKEAVYNECHYNKHVFKKPAAQMPGYGEFNDINEFFGQEIRVLLEQSPKALVHIHDFQLLYLYRYIPRGMPLVLTWHIPFTSGISKPLSNFLLKHLNEYDKVIFSSPEYIKAAVKAGLEKEKAVLIHPIANTELFHPLDIDIEKTRKRYRIPANTKMILCVQRIDAKSGHEQLLKAMPAILREVSEAKLVFVGGKSLSNKISGERQVYENRVFDLIKKLKLKRHVIFTGNVDYEKLPELYNACDVVALVSKNEGFGLSVSEGMACGKPVVGTRVGGIPLQVKHNYNGFLVNAGDRKKTAERIIQLLSKNSLRKKMGKHSLEIVEKKFKMEMGVEKHLVLYNQVMHEKNEYRRLEHLDFNEVSTIVTDFDRTITDSTGKLGKKVLRELKSLKKDLFLATGRSLGYVRELERKNKNTWRCIIAENGGVLFFPRTGKVIIISSEHSRLARKKVKAMKVKALLGEVSISVKKKDFPRVKRELRSLTRNLEFRENIDDVLILPKGVDKGSGLKLTQEFLNIDPEKTILIGDGENDVDLFKMPGFKIALANAVKKLRDLADQTTTFPSSKGVLEIVRKLKEAN